MGTSGIFNLDQNLINSGFLGRHRFETTAGSHGQRFPWAFSLDLRTRGQFPWRIDRGYHSTGENAMTKLSKSLMAPLLLVDDQSRRVLLLATFVCAFCVGGLAADPPQLSTKPELPAITRGQKVTLHGANLPDQKDMKAVLRTDAKDEGLSLPATRESATTVSFMLPKDMKTGAYLVSLVLGPNPNDVLPAAGQLNVLEDEAAKVALEAIRPTTVYPSDVNDGFDFDLAGQNLAQSLEDNIIRADNVPLPMGSKDQCATYKIKRHYDNICLAYGDNLKTRLLHVTGFHPAKDKGAMEIQVQVGNNVSNGLGATFSGISKNAARLTSIVIFLVLVLIVLGLVWKGIGQYKIGDEKYSPVAAFLLDKETDSFSLSKFQLLAWTSVAIFGYVYLFLCHVFIQWNFAFPPIPDGLPTLLGISAGTVVAATGITVTRGSKGAGPIHPSIADFISSGGLVAADRFQFFVWTLVGCLGFLGILLKSDPAALTDLPSIPQNFLFLMGISSAGYLGGKVVRKPGPVINLLSVTAVTPAAAGPPATPAVMTMNLTGENLASDATVNVDDQAMRKDQYSINPLKRQDQAPDPSFCTELTLTLNDATKYLEGVHSLTLTNGDGQAAQMSFPMDPLSIDSIPDATHSAAPAPTVVTVNGKNFCEHTSAEWTVAGGAPVPIPEAQVTRKSEVQLTVSLPVATAAKGKLTLVSQIGLRASKDVNIN